MTLLDAALNLHHHGCSVVPVRTDGTKAPAVTWKHGQAHRAELAQLEAWFTGNTYDGLGVITGAVSGNLEMLEVEGRATDLIPQLAALITDHGQADLWARLCSGYLERSPSGGMHWLYRVDGPALGNTKLARRPGEHPGTIDVLIETRGEGGFTVTAPSAGRSHPTGQPWTLLAGGPATIPNITIDERDFLHEMARMLDAMPVVPADRHLTIVGPGHTPTTDRDGDRPGDDYNNRATWDDILTPHGWTRTRQFGPGFYGWTRPGKNPTDGISATTGRNDADNLFVFSSSTEFETEKAYSKFAAYTLLNHAGDYAAAARDLRARGYGKPAEPSRPADITELLADHQTPTSDSAPTNSTNGNLASVLTQPARPIALVDERTLERSDDGNALLLIERFGDRIRYVPERDRWIAWNGRRWTWAAAGGGVVREYAKRVARSLPEGDQAANSHKKKSLSANGTTAMITQAETDERITASFEELDAHPLELNTPAGAVDLTTGSLEPPDQTKLHTRSTSIAPDTDQPTPMWDEFLAETFAGHTDLVPFVQRLAGYSATGAVTHHILPFLHGPGGNGKSVFLDVLRALLGDYAGSAPPKFLMAGQQQHETEIARLSGLRMIICSEVNQNDKFDEAKVKLLTGGDALTARFMRQDHFTFTPTHHLWLMGNHQPKVAGGGESFWRRLRIVSFSNIVPDEKKDETLPARLIAQEGPGILAWIIEGARQAVADGLGAPATVMADTNTYASEEDVLARFMADRCHIGGGNDVRIPTAELRSAYANWCNNEGETPLAPQVMGRELRTRYGIEQTRSNGKRYYLGVTLLADENEPERPEEWWEK